MLLAKVDLLEKKSLKSIMIRVFNFIKVSYLSSIIRIRKMKESSFIFGIAEVQCLKWRWKMVLLQQATAYIFRKKTRNFILLVFLFLSYASWWRNGGTNQEVRWSKFFSGK